MVAFHLLLKTKTHESMYRIFTIKITTKLIKRITITRESVYNDHMNKT